MGIALKGRTILSAALALVIAIALSFPGMALADPDESSAADTQTEATSADTTASDTAADEAADDDVQAADLTGVDDAANQPAAEPADANADAAAPAAATDGVAKVASTGLTYGTVQEAVDAAGTNDTITLTANTEENVTVKDKVLNFTADSKDVTFKGTLRFQGGTDGSMVKNIHFVLDGTTSVAQSVVFQGTKNAEVSGNTFDITTGADKLNKQMSSVWLQDAANNVTVADNDFNVAWGAERSNVGINLVGGAPLDSTTISGNTFTGTPAAVDKPTGSAMFVVGNGNTTEGDTYGITNLKVTDNTVVNNTGKEGANTRVYGVSVIGTKGSNAAVLNYGTATVEGGTLTAGNDNARVVRNIKVDQSPKSSPGSFEMTGGTIYATGNQTALYQDVANGVGTIKVSGGTVNGPIAVSKAVDDDPTAGIALSGGTYSEAPADAYVVEGSGLNKQDDGTYAVAKAQIVFANAANGTVSYAISKGALDEAGIIALFGAQLTVDEGYSDVAVDAASLKALNDAIAAGTVGSYEMTFTAEKKADGAVVETLTAKGTVNLTKDGAPGDQVTDNKTPNDQNQNDDVDKTAKSQSPKTSDSMMLYAAAAVALAALGGVGVSLAMRRRFNK